MRDLSELYVEKYLTENTAPKQPEGVITESDIEEIENAMLDLDLDDDFDLNETYYAGGDEKGGKKKPLKKGKKSVKSESFQSLAKSILSEEFDMDYEDDGGFDDGFEDDGFEDDGDMVSIPRSTLTDIISQLEGIMGGGDDFDDDFDEFETEFDDANEYDDDFDSEFDDDLEDDFPTESWDGGKGDQRMRGDYSGKPKAGGNGGNLSSKGNSKVKGKLSRSEGGSTGDQRMRGDTSGKANSLRASDLHSKGKAKTNFRKANPEEDLFG